MAPEVDYRDRGPEELEDAARLVERIFREEYDIPLGGFLAEEVESARRRFDPQRDLFTTAEIGGLPAGALLVTHDDDNPGISLFGWLVVEGAARGRGIGRELIFRGLETCRQRGRTLLRARIFAFSPAALHLFWLHGFRVVGLDEVVVGGRPREALLLEKRLSPPGA